ncbi:hypothetical protein [Jiulongibacter sp. NS-SX5]|uniref:hypothetical protein n=1 Tax=Jiulongibacter sp. NS-SX5 TaxID=3463854 RepID=UPI004058F7C4
MKRPLILFLILFLFQIAKAQEPAAHKESHTPPIPVELFVGDRAINILAVTTKPFKEGGKWGYFNFTNYTGDFKNTGEHNEFASQSLLTYKLTKHLSATAGFLINHVTGFRKQIGLQYSYASKTWLVVLVPVLDLADGNNLEMMDLVEYKPQLNDKLSLYTRLQGLIIYNPTDKHHARSYLTARLGLGIKNYQLGLGHTTDWYGENHFVKHNTGIFARVLLEH